MQIVILCGGYATRLGNIAKNTPKSMIEVRGKPFLEYQIEQLKKQSIIDIILCVGHLYKKIQQYFNDGKKFGVNIKYSYDGDKPLGPIGALKKAEILLDDIFFIMYGDSFLSLDFKLVYQHFLQQKKHALMTIYENHDKYDKSNVVSKDGKVIKYDEKKTEDMIYVDYGASIFRKKILDLIPPNTYYTTKDLFIKLVEKNELSAFEVKKRFYHIGTYEGLEEFRKNAQKLTQN